MTFRLDAVDAYERGLVKQIEVASLQIDSGHNKPYIRLDSTHNRKGSITAKVEVDVQRGKNVRREFYDRSRTVTIWGKTTGRCYLRNIYRIGTITCGKDNDTIEVKGDGFDQTTQARRCNWRC